jgi:hypothetical protein
MLADLREWMMQPGIPNGEFTITLDAAVVPACLAIGYRWAIWDSRPQLVGCVQFAAVVANWDKIPEYRAAKLADLRVAVIAEHQRLMAAHHLRNASRAANFIRKNLS